MLSQIRNEWATILLIARPFLSLIAWNGVPLLDTLSKNRYFDYGNLSDCECDRIRSAPNSAIERVFGIVFGHYDCDPQKWKKEEQNLNEIRALFEMYAIADAFSVVDQDACEIVDNVEKYFRDFFQALRLADKAAALEVDNFTRRVAERSIKSQGSFTFS